MRRCAFLGFVLVALVLPSGAGASELITRNATDVVLRVNAEGQAMLSYSTKGRRWNVLAWGAVNALPPQRGGQQVAFKLDYSGGWGTYRRKLWQSFRNVCRPYTGPPLAWFVTACTAPDGSHWGVQSWQRMLPNYGVKPTPDRAVWELRLSHWTGELPELVIHANWAYRKFDHIYGSFAFHGEPAYGYKWTLKGNPLDTWGRNVYVDTFNSAYGPGWRRENSFLTHPEKGNFCYGFYPHGPYPSGKGERYRATVIGPGVAPDVKWEGVPLGPYDAGHDRELLEHQRVFHGSDPRCKPV